MNETEERRELKKDKVRTAGYCETKSSDVSPKECERSISTESPYSILLEDIVDDGTKPRKTSTEKCITVTLDNIRNSEDKLDLSLSLTENELPTETQKNESTHIDEMESTQVEVNLVGVVKMGENVVCDDGQENDSEEQEKDADEINQENDLTDVLLFADTLLANLRKTKSRGKELLKWEGKIQDLKDFVELVLKSKGASMTKPRGKKNSHHIFKEENGDYILNWWPTTKTLSLQGESGITEKIEKKIEGLITRLTTQPAEIVDEILVTPDKKQKRVTKGSQATNSDIKKIWESIDELKEAVSQICQNLPTKESIETNTVSTANSKKKSNQSKRKQKLEKSTCPKRDGLITSYFEPIEKSESQKKIDMMIRISELENKVKKLENEKLQLMKEISNLTKKNTELSQKYETGKRNTNVGMSTNSPDTFQKRSGKPQKRRGQTNVDKVKVEDNKMKVEVKENEVRTKNNEKGKKDKVRKLDDDKRDKPLVIVAGDSMLRDINGWMMSRSNKVKVHSFSGANTSDMTHFLQPLMKKKPDHVLIHIGTNNLCDNLLSPDDIAHNVVNLVKSVTSEGIKCSVSSLIQRNDELWEKGQKVNVALKRILPDQCSFIDNSNINT